jgi:predicted amidohydrolase YtcJ
MSRRRPLQVLVYPGWTTRAGRVYLLLHRVAAPRLGLGAFWQGVTGGVEPVEAGLPPRAALEAATINAARAMGRDDRLGSIEVGKLGDLAVLTRRNLNE